MKSLFAGLGSLSLAACLVAVPVTASAQEGPPAPPAAQTEDVQPPPPAPTPAVYNYPTGSWVYAADRGWVWVPAGASTTAVDGVPYTYLYTPTYGWTWYVSPWGWGGYHYGPWVAHPWRPVGWRAGWVARPHVIGRIGGPRRGWRR